MSKHKRIFIAGQSGAGKGVVAQEVAKQLGWKFINADVLASVASMLPMSLVQAVKINSIKH